MLKSIKRLWVIFAITPLFYLLLTGYFVAEDLYVYEKYGHIYANYFNSANVDDKFLGGANESDGLLYFTEILDDTSHFLGHFKMFDHFSVALNFVPLLGYELHSFYKVTELTSQQITEVNRAIHLFESSNLLSERSSNSFNENLSDILLETSRLLGDEEGLFAIARSFEQKTNKIVDEGNKSISAHILINYTFYGKIEKRFMGEVQTFLRLEMFVQDGVELANRQLEVYDQVVRTENFMELLNDRHMFLEELSTIKDKSDSLKTAMHSLDTGSDQEYFVARTAHISADIFELNSHILKSLIIRLEAISDVEFGEDSGNIEILNSILSEIEPVNEQATFEIELAANKLNQLSKTEIPILGSAVESRYELLMAHITRKFDELERLNYWIPIMSDFSGINGERFFLLMAHSADELRATGGFVSAVWLLNVHKDSTYELTYYDVAHIDDLSKLSLYPDPPDLLREHMGAWVWLIRDVSWHPEFKDTAVSAQSMFQTSVGVSSDGVIGFNQYALTSLLDRMELVKKIGVEEEIDIRELMSIVQKGTDDVGREYMDNLLQNIIVNLSEDMELNSLFYLLEDLEYALHSKDIMIYSEDEKLYEILQYKNWTGSFSEIDWMSNPIYVVDSNVGWSKVDRNIERNTNIEVSFPNLNETLTKLRVSYINHSTNSVSECEPQWNARGVTYKELMNSCYWNLFRIIFSGDELLSIDGNVTLPHGSVSADTGLGKAGSSTIKHSSYDGNLSQLSGLIVVDEGTTETAEFIIKNEEVLLGEFGDCLSYYLTVVKQPGVTNRKYAVSFVPPAGYKNHDIVVDGVGPDTDYVLGSSYEGYLKSDVQVMARFIPHDAFKCG